MNILGIAAPFGHDHSAALLVDGKIVAAVEEERFTRKRCWGSLEQMLSEKQLSLES